MTCYAHISWQYVSANRSWPHAAKMVDTGLAMQNRSTGFICVNPADQDSGRESVQCGAVCTAATKCQPTGCC
jgi:hypothetical protein